MMNLVKRLLGDRRGNVAMLFAVSAVPLITAVGAAVDYSRAASIRTELQADTDAAALIACKSTLTADSDLKALAQTALNGYLPNYAITLPSWTSTNAPRSIDLTSKVVYPTRFMRMFNITTVDITARASCAAGESFYEVAMVLDTTGSMGNSAGGGTTKIAAMRTAATNFVNTMFSSFDTTHLKMSLVPFAAAVKVNPLTYAPAGIPLPTATWLDTSGTSTAHWQNILNPAASSFTNRFDVFRKLTATNALWSWAGCFEALPYPYNTQDAAPTSATPNTRYVPLLAPDEIGTEQFLFGFIDLNSQDVSSPQSTNSYIDDGTASSGACNNANSNKSTRMGQACKYVTPKNAHSSMDGPNWGCTSQALQRLTTLQTTLTTQIGTLAASGSTNIAEGLHWGWQTLTPTGVFNDGAAYNAANTHKIVILMTDGVNTWNANSSAYVTKSDYSAFGYFNNADGSNTAARLPTGYSSLTTDTDARNAMDQVTTETCTNMKAKGVEIYTIAFSTPGDAIDASGQTLLANCATDASHAYLATDASSLNTVFQNLAKSIGQLRITK